MDRTDFTYCNENLYELEELLEYIKQVRNNVINTN